MWELFFTKQAGQDAKKLRTSNLKKKAQKILDILEKDPLQTPPPLEKLKGDLQGCYSRRINIQHRVVYEIFPDTKQIKILRM